mmetsp:Transcript_30839/g.35111  ORF Transcript_30839/g.35111 Transcript_30839/m.35111 type:complete len:192 (-) Transcript_30839:1319-1894(-)
MNATWENAQKQKKRQREFKMNVVKKYKKMKGGDEPDSADTGSKNIYEQVYKKIQDQPDQPKRIESKKVRTHSEKDDEETKITLENNNGEVVTTTTESQDQKQSSKTSKLHQKKSNKSKPNPFKREFEKAKQAKSEEQKKQQQEKEQIDREKRQKSKDRRKNRILLSKKNDRGQPVMKHQLKYLLDKIEKGM